MPADDLSNPPWPGVITQRLGQIVPKPAGTRETIRLQYGPITIAPGGDGTAISVDVSMVEGFAVGSQPRLRFADGATADHTEGVHLHHAHLFRLAHDQKAVGNTCPGCEWVFGTGDEQTTGSFEKIAAADGPGGPQYGTRFYRGDAMLFISMPMNMTTEPKTVYTEFAFEFVHGTPEEIKEATGVEYRPITGVLHGTTFNVPKTGGFFRWPMDAAPFTESGLAATDLDPESFMSAQPSGSGAIRRGVGHIWTAPSDGVIMGAAGHTHGGAKGIVFSNLGSEERPCGDVDGDGIPGTRIFKSKAYYPPGIFPAHLKMGVTQPGWRVYVEKGDRIATNGVFDSRFYAWPDQMSVVGMYWDHNVDVDPAQRCRPVLVDEPDATLDEITQSIPDQDSKRGDDGSHLFHSHGPEPCVGDECNDYDAPPLPPGEHTDTITINDFRFSAGDMTVNGLGGGKPKMDGTAPVVTRGEKLRFVNLDYLRYPGTRHAPTSCHGPCNGPDAMSYPSSDGLFYSGPMGYLLLAEYASNDNQLLPVWDLDTSTLEEGYYTYYCWQHPWMRGAFYVDDPAG